MPIALITGITGQDGSYLAEFLLSKGYQVVGLTRHSTTGDFSRIQHIRDQVTLAQADLHDQGSLLSVLNTYHPDEIYNLGGQSNTQLSWSQTVLTAEATAIGVARILECMHQATPNARFYQASTSEMFGDAPSSPQNESTPFNPRNPYGVSKVYGHFMTGNYRKHFGLYAVSGILYNHESPRRGVEFVTRKITHGAARIKLGQAEKLVLGNLDSMRDWGFAGDYVRAMWLMLQQDKADDYVIGTGIAHMVREFCEIAFSTLDLDYQDYVVVDPAFVRPPEEYPLVADPSHAKRILGWQSETSFEQLVQMMVEADLKALVE
jgi:GDPmannose 4,6-dehydratase